MPEAIKLKNRAVLGGTAARALRRAGEIPGLVYGHNIKPRHFVIAENKLIKIFKEFGTSSIFDVQIEGEEKPVKVILHEWQNHPVSSRPTHVDLYQVRMDEKLHTNVNLQFVGVALSVKDLGGTLVKQHSALAIECLPGDLIHEIKVNIESLKTFADVIRVKDLLVPPTIKILADANEIIAQVTPPRSEAELAALTQEVKEDLEAVEVVAKKKEEEAGEADEGKGAEQVVTDKKSAK